MSDVALAHGVRGPVSWTEHPLIELTRTRILEFAREPEALFWVFIFPVLLAAGLGLAELWTEHLVCRNFAERENLVGRWIQRRNHLGRGTCLAHLMTERSRGAGSERSTPVVHGHSGTRP